MEQYASQSGALKLLRELLAPRHLFPVRDPSYGRPVIGRLRICRSAKFGDAPGVANRQLGTRIVQPWLTNAIPRGSRTANGLLTQLSKLLLSYA